MKKLHISLLAVLAVLFAGCTTLKKEKLPAGDIDIYSKYASEIATLHNPKLRPDSKEKYEAAMTLYKNVDFSFLRELYTLEKIFSPRDAYLGKVNFDRQDIIFLYRYKGKRVRFVFTRFKNAIIHSECTDQVN